ncbi:MFS transporter [Paracoccus kondratievae]|uniref:MFS transporter n=1 Tax=Paracoccus kondratievae TaxID=135740 RepID=UPI00126657CD|nr:MFS transporter [Paracoccus kondratievae]QFQ86699.1 MFS transporter [Paracoccus kondratievae]
MTETTEPRSYFDEAGRAAFVQRGLPVGSLLALAVAGFITILTEALPAGLLPQISGSLLVSESLTGQLVTIYALGSLLTVIPLIALTQAVRRKPLLLIALAGFAIANTVTALSTSYVLTMMARFVAGVSAGLLWALLAGYAARMVPDQLKGRAIAVAMIGTPLALSLGIPAGTFLGTLIGWRSCFGLMTAMTLALIMWMLIKLPDFPGQADGRRHSLGEVFRMPGIRSVLLATLGYMLAHNILYTYIAPFVSAARMVGQTTLILLVFGLTSLVSIWIAGALVDRHLRSLTLASIALFAVSALVLGIGTDSTSAVYAAICLWGLAYGGAATLFATSMTRVAGEATDVAQSMIVTVWNIAIAGGGILGGILLNNLGAVAFPWSVLALLVVTLAVVWAARAHGFRSS